MKCFPSCEEILTIFKSIKCLSDIIKFDVFTYINQVLTSGIFSNITSSYVAYDVYGYPTGSYNEPASDYFFWDLIHPTTKAHELLAKEVAVKIKQSFTDDSDTDDNSDNGSYDGSSGSSCFIDSASEMSFGSNSDVLILVFSAGFFVAAFLSCRRNNS